MVRAAIERSKLGELTKIDQGGQGVVYHAPKVKTKFAASLVYKEYKPQARDGIDFGALAAMPDLVENSLCYADGERLVSMAAWPCAIVEDGGTPTGFVMPEIPGEFFISLRTLKGVSRNVAGFQQLLNPESVLDARGIVIDEVQRYALLGEVASALAFLHSNGVCVGDISPKNLLFSLEPREAVYFIDCDTMRIDDVSALPQVETPGWEVPRGEELATVYSDAYKLGLLALRLLAGDQDAKSPKRIPSSAPNLLRGLITDTLNRPAQKRPLPATWTYVLGQALEEAQHRKKIAPPPPPPPGTAPPRPPHPPPQPHPPTATFPPKTGSWQLPPRAKQALSQAVRASMAGRRRARKLLPLALFVVLLVIIVSNWPRGPGDGGHPGPIGNSSPSTSVTPSLSFNSMRDFVTAYYDDLPTRPYDAWAKLDPHHQNQVGQREFLDFWATLQSVKVVSISPRDATSVDVRLTYVRSDGTSYAQDRWLKIVSVNGALLLDQNELIGSASVSPSSTTSRPTTLQPTTTTTVPPDTIGGLLLSPDQISDVMAAPGMRVVKTYTTMKEPSSELSDKACLPLANPVDAVVYADSGWYAIRGQGLDETSWNHRVYQNVVWFSSAHDANRFFTASAQRWPICANREFTVTHPDMPDRVWTVGPVSNTGQILGANKTELVEDGWTCHRALTAAENVVIDVEACGKPQYDISPHTAFSIAQQIALKVPTR